MAGHVRSTELTFARRANSAWRDLEHAEDAIKRHQAEHPDPRHKTILKEIGVAKTALRRAWSAFSPRSKRMPRLDREERKEPLWRCRYCKGLVWESERELHLKASEIGRWALTGPAAKLEHHFEPAPAQLGDEGEDDEEDDDANPY